MHTKNILVVGGAGFIGSHMVNLLKKNNFNIYVLDNLSTGHRDAIQDVEFILGDVGDSFLLAELFKTKKIDAVMHFASHIEVSESMQQPRKYYANNLAKTIYLLNCIIEFKIKYFIFSSSAAVYGNPCYTPIDETHSLRPINPYGQTKLMVETILQDYAKAYELKFAILRYFNAAGCDPSGKITERHQPESHLIPLILDAMFHKKIFFINGDDYETPDGTCIRDFVHVNDICEAHLQSLNFLMTQNKNHILNLGTGRGYSIKEIIEVAKLMSGLDLQLQISKRRFGDPAILVANPNKAKAMLQWHPRFSSLQNILKDLLYSLSARKVLILNNLAG